VTSNRLSRNNASLLLRIKCSLADWLLEDVKTNAKPGVEKSVSRASNFF